MEIANLTLVLAVHVMNHIHMCALGHTPYVCDTYGVCPSAT